MAITLKAARVNRGYTQDAAAKIIGVTVDTISNWERGKSFPNVPQLKRIEEAYGVTYNELIFLPNSNG